MLADPRGLSLIEAGFEIQGLVEAFILNGVRYPEEILKVVLRCSDGKIAKLREEGVI